MVNADTTEVLRQTAGIQFKQNGGPGQFNEGVEQVRHDTEDAVTRLFTGIFAPSESVTAGAGGLADAH